MTDRDADFLTVQKSQTSHFLRNVRDAEPTLLFGATICALIGFIDFFFNGLAVASIIALCIVTVIAGIGFVALWVEKYMQDHALSIVVSSTVTAAAFSAATFGFLYATGSLSSVTQSMVLGMKPAPVCDILPSYCTNRLTQTTPTPAEKQRSDVIVLRYGSVSADKAAGIMRSLSFSGWNLRNGVAAIEMGAPLHASSSVWYFHEQDKTLADAIALEAALAKGLTQAFPVVDFSTTIAQPVQDKASIAPGHIRILLADI